MHLLEIFSFTRYRDISSAVKRLFISIPVYTVHVNNGFSLVTIQSWRKKFLKCNIDVVASTMNDRCLRENFACLSLAENVHKKII